MLIITVVWLFPALPIRRLNVLEKLRKSYAIERLFKNDSDHS